MPFSRHRRRYLVDSVSRHHDGAVVTEFSSLVMVEEFSCFVAVHSSPFVWFLVFFLVQRVSAAINMLLILTARLVGDVW
jgi:hypothetical protein